MKKLMFVLMALMCLCIPVFASGGAEAFKAEFFSVVLIPALTSLAGVLAAMILWKLEKVTGIKLKAEQRIYIRKMAEESVQYVAEYAAREIKDGSKIPSRHKRERAIGKLMKDVPKLSAKEADEAIHAALARVHGQGATVKAVR